MKFVPFFAATIAVGVLAGWLAPGSPDAPPVPRPATELARSDELALLQQEQWLAGDVVLARSPDGHFYADVEADGASVHMLVDTGATTVALTAEDAETLGIEWSPDDVRPVARGASGDVHGVRVEIERLQLGGLEVENVGAIVVPEGLGISLLGQSFLSQIERVEMDRNRMVLGG